MKGGPLFSLDLLMTSEFSMQKPVYNTLRSPCLNYINDLKVGENGMEWKSHEFYNQEVLNSHS